MVNEKDIREIEQGWLTLNEFIPIRREGEEIPAGEHGCFSIQWWRGPCLIYREGTRVVRMGVHLYADTPSQHLGGYVEED